MKFFNVSVAAVLAFTSFAQGAVILPRQDAANTSNNNSTSVESQYPNMTDLGVANGTWFLTAVTSNVFDAYQNIASKMSLSANCINFVVNATSNNTLDLIGSGFVENNVTKAGVNGTVAGILSLQSPDNNVNVTDNELYWMAYFSQIYVNSAQWQNFTTGSAGGANDSSQAITDPMQANVYSKFIDSTGNNNTANPDTILVWANSYQKLDSDNNQDDNSSTLTRRDGNDGTSTDNNTIYAMLLSRVPSVDEETFNKTLTFLPSRFNESNANLINFNDTCTAGADSTDNTDANNNNQ